MIKLMVKLTSYNPLPHARMIHFLRISSVFNVEIKIPYSLSSLQINFHQTQEQKHKGRKITILAVAIVIVPLLITVISLAY